MAQPGRRRDPADAPGRGHAILLAVSSTGLDAATRRTMIGAPLRLADNRVYRFYEGGMALDGFVGRTAPRDGDHPEDWVGSLTRANNPGGDPDEGIGSAVVDGRAIRLDVLLGGLEDLAFGAAHVRAFGTSPGLLVKLLDAGVRLPIHCHPTRAFARARFGSFFGKTEAWIVVGTRDDDAHVLLGFREGTTKDDFRRHLERQDVEDLAASLHRVPARAGDVFYVRAGLPHAIGQGVFLVELQEPTDFSIVAEWSGFPIAPADAHLGIGWDAAFEAFDFTGWSEDALVRTFRHAPRVLRDDAAAREEALFAPEAHPYFAATRLEVRAEARVDAGFYVGIVTRGHGVVAGAFGERTVRAGDRFLVTAAVGEHTLRGPGLEVLRCLPPVAAGTERGAG
jgi:mannose-6-phosphate isomerase